jgi:hypothetical protein
MGAPPDRRELLRTLGPLSPSDMVAVMRIAAAAGVHKASVPVDDGLLGDVVDPTAQRDRARPHVRSLDTTRPVTASAHPPKPPAAPSDYPLLAQVTDFVRREAGDRGQHRLGVLAQ